MNKDSRILVLGSTGLVGSSIVRTLKRQNYSDVFGFSRKDNHGTTLSDCKSFSVFLESNGFEYVFLAAAKVGGIMANSTFPADFIYDNLKIQTNVIHACKIAKIKKLLFLGSSCIYPKFAKQPINESEFMTGPLEPTNEPYAIAKIAGIRMLQAYQKQYGMAGISLMPTNLYGPGDNYDTESSHVLPAMIKKFHNAKVNNLDKVYLWGTGTPRREFLYVDDMAKASVFLMNNYDSPEIINVGFGWDISIRALSEIVAFTVGYTGEIFFDKTKPDGTPRKMLDCTKIFNLGWEPEVGIYEGVKETYKSFLNGEGRGIDL